MGKKATTRSRTSERKTKPKSAGARAVTPRASSRSNENAGKAGGFRPGEGLIKLLQSPLVAELVAVAATAALAALAEHGFSTGTEATRGNRAGRALKEAGKAAAAAIGRRLSTEIDEIRRSATTSTNGATA